jgi:hypothetical protein
MNIIFWYLLVLWQVGRSMRHHPSVLPSSNAQVNPPRGCQPIDMNGGRLVYRYIPPQPTVAELSSHRNFQSTSFSSALSTNRTSISQSGFGIAFHKSALRFLGAIQCPSRGITSYRKMTIATKLRITFVEKCLPGHIVTPAPKGRNAEVLESFFFESDERNRR